MTDYNLRLSPISDIGASIFYLSFSAWRLIYRKLHLENIACLSTETQNGILVRFIRFLFQVVWISLSMPQFPNLLLLTPQICQIKGVYAIEADHLYSYTDEVLGRLFQTIPNLTFPVFQQSIYEAKPHLYQPLSER